MCSLILKSFVSRSISPTLSLAPLVNSWMVMLMRSVCYMSSLVCEVVVKYNSFSALFNDLHSMSSLFRPHRKGGRVRHSIRRHAPPPPHHRLQTKAFLDKFRVVHDSLYHSFHPIYDVVGTQDM